MSTRLTTPTSRGRRTARSPSYTRRRSTSGGSLSPRRTRLVGGQLLTNPETGRQIEKGGKTYEALLARGYRLTPSGELERTAAPIPERQAAEYVINPRTGRQVRVGSALYNELERQEGSLLAQQKPISGRRRGRAHVEQPVTGRAIESSVALGRAKPLNLETVLRHTTQPAKRRDLEHEILKAGQGRGGATRGWAAAKPQRGRERKELHNRCGDACFLQPDSLGFPICSKLIPGEEPCKVSCEGLTAAKVRANQWKYPEVSRAAEEIRSELGCTQETARRRRSAASPRVRSPSSSLAQTRRRVGSPVTRRRTIALQPLQE